jgi:hypothetical protein
VKQTPYKHSPEEGTPEAEQQPWRIHVPLALPVDPDDATPPEEPASDASEQPEQPS